MFERSLTSDNIRFITGIISRYSIFDDGINLILSIPFLLRIQGS